MWLVSCRGQGMLTQGLAPDPKCKLNIPSFFTLPHSSYCLVCAKVIMITVVTANDGRIGRLGDGSFMLGFGWGDRQWVSYFYIFYSVFVLLLIVLL